MAADAAGDQEDASDSNHDVPALLEALNKAQKEVNRWHAKAERIRMAVARRQRRLPAELRMPLANEQAVVATASQRLDEAKAKYQQVLDTIERASLAHGRRSLRPEAKQSQPVRWRRVVLHGAPGLAPTRAPFMKRNKVPWLGVLIALAVFHVCFTAGIWLLLRDSPLQPAALKSFMTFFEQAAIISTVYWTMLFWYLCQAGKHRLDIGMDMQPAYALGASYLFNQVLLFVLACRAYQWEMSETLSYIFLCDPLGGTADFFYRATMLNRVILAEQASGSLDMAARTLRTLIFPWVLIVLSCVALAVVLTRCFDVPHLPFVLMSALSVVNAIIWFIMLVVIGRSLSNLVHCLRLRQQQGGTEDSGLLFKMRAIRVTMLISCFGAGVYCIAVVIIRAPTLAILSSWCLLCVQVVDFVALVFLVRIFDVLDVHFTDADLSNMLVPYQSTRSEESICDAPDLRGGTEVSMRGHLLFSVAGSLATCHSPRIGQASASLDSEAVREVIKGLTKTTTDEVSSGDLPPERYLKASTDSDLAIHEVRKEIVVKVGPTTPTTATATMEGNSSSYSLA